MQQGKRAWIVQDGPTSSDLRCRWYIAKGGKTDGPYAYEEVIFMVQKGRLTRDHYLWRPGFKQWIAVSARSDFRQELPPRPRLGVVPALEEAKDQQTEDIQVSQDIVDTKPVESEAAQPVETDHASRALARLAEGPTPEIDDDTPEFGLPERRHLPRISVSGGILLGLALVFGYGIGSWQYRPTKNETALTPMKASAARSSPAKPAGFMSPTMDLAPSVSQGVPAESTDLDVPADHQEPAESKPKHRRIAPPKATKPSEDLSWLNRRAIPEPQTVGLSVARTPTRVRLEPESAPSLRLESKPVPNGLADEMAGKVVSAHLSDFARCAKADRLTMLPVGTEVDIRVTNPGKVRTVSVRGVSAPVSSCIRRKVQRWKFPRNSGKEAKVKLKIGRGGTVRTLVSNSLL